MGNHEDSLGSIRLAFRSITHDEAEAISRLESVYGERTRPLAARVTSLVARFPTGQIAIVDDDAVVASLHTIRTTESHLAGRPTWEGATDGGLARVHDPRGDVLFVVSLAFDHEQIAAIVGMALCRALIRRARTLGLRRVIVPAIGDLRFAAIRQALIAAGFSETLRAKDFFPGDHGHRHDATFYTFEISSAATHPRDEPRGARGVRVAAIQHRMAAVDSFDAAASRWGESVAAAADAGCRFVLFPELLTTELFSLLALTHAYDAARALDRYTKPYVAFFRECARKHRLHVIGGTHLTLERGLLFNDAYLFHPDGRVSRQRKVHVTPWESESCGVSPGASVEVFDTPDARVAIVICYDVAFPELVRVARAKGAEIVFVPYNADRRAAHVRVRACAHARAIENHLYVVTAGACGSLVSAMERFGDPHAESAIFTPSDVGTPNGIAASATANEQSMLVADLDVAELRKSDRVGGVRTFHDRRSDIYRLRYLGLDGEIDV